MVQSLSKIRAAAQLELCGCSVRIVQLLSKIVQLLSKTVQLLSKIVQLLSKMLQLPSKMALLFSRPARRFWLTCTVSISTG